MILRLVQSRNPLCGKKIAAVHFPIIPCEPNTANRHIESHIFGEICPCTNGIAYARFEVFRTLLTGSRTSGASVCMFEI